MSDTEGTSPDPTPDASDAQTPDAASVAHTGDTGATIPLPASPETPAAAADQQQTTPIPPAAYGLPPQQVPAQPPFPAAGQPHPHDPAYAQQSAPQPQAAPAYGQPHAAPHVVPVPGESFGAAASEPPAAATTAQSQKKSGAGKIVGLLVAAALVGGAAGLGTAYAGSTLWAPTASTGGSSPQVVTVNNTDSVNATTAIATKVLPSVVTINVASGNSGGTGSGVILSKDGYVLTNTHVVTLDGATGSATISVTTSDGHVYAASVVGTDPTYDLAVIKLKDASGLTPIQWGDSSKINVGDQTVAVGAPLGLSNTVTTGIVSALNRSIEIASSAAPDSSSQDGSGNGNGDGNGNGNGSSPFYFDFGQGQTQQQTTDTIKIAVIQTDAAINPGNSGGALVDGDGKLIGINVAIASTGSTSSSSGQSGSIGVGFSIPSDIAKRIADDLVADGKATHGLLGATVSDAASQQNATTTGAYIASVTSGGAAAAAGLQKGDVVTQFNGVPISDAVDLTAQVRALAGGAKASVTYVRDGQTHTAQVTLGTLQQ